MTGAPSRLAHPTQGVYTQAMPRKKKPTLRPARVTTGSKSIPPVTFRVSIAQRAELEAEAQRLGLGGPNEAAKRRTFPGT